MMNPKLSVIMPVYNTASYLNKAVESILGQSFGDFELICVDNHSDDGGGEILREYAARDERVRYIQTPVFGRATETRNFGLPFAQGEFITYVDSDDSVKPGIYERMFEEQIKHDADIVVCNYDMVYPDRIEAEYSAMRTEVVSISEIGYSEWFYRYFCMNRPNNYLWSRIIRRSLAAENGISFHPVDISEDSIFTMLCAAYSDRIAYIRESYYNYFQREDSEVRQTVRRKDIAKSFVYAFKTVEEYAASHGLTEKFAEIFPLYAFTRIRSILFYIQLVGSSEAEAYSKLRSAIAGTSIPRYLRRAVSCGYLEKYANIQGFTKQERDRVFAMAERSLEGVSS